MSETKVNWSQLGFNYQKTDFRYMSKWKDGEWDKGELVTENTITVSEGSTTFHYGQQCFEGLKAYQTKDGKINIFRVNMNAKRFQKSCKRISMPIIPEKKFIEAVKQVVEANKEFVPPYGSGATLYIRPFMIGVGDNLGTHPAKEYIFRVFCVPVGPYFKGGFKPVDFQISELDRAAPAGTGAVKVGGNYAASLLPHDIAADRGFADCVYLDPATHTKVEEVGSANFFGITQDTKFVTPKSPSILPSITKYSLIHIASEYLGMEVEERDVYVDEIGEFVEVGACGTAAVITPIGGIEHKGEMKVCYSQEEVGPMTKKLYDTLVGIQIGDITAPEGWIYQV